MKNRLMKKLAALALSGVMLFSGSISALAQTPAGEINEGVVVEEQLEEVVETIQEYIIGIHDDLTYMNEQVIIKVYAEQDEIIPVGTKIKVIPILQDNEETKEVYEQVAASLQEKVAENEQIMEGFLAYDITLEDPEGNEFKPYGEVKVSIEYKEAIESSEVTIHHFEEDEEGNVKEIVDMVATEVALTEATEVEKVEFVTDSFSTYAITWQANDENVSLAAEKVNELTTIETVDHTADGIIMRLIDYDKGQNELRNFGNEASWSDGYIRYNVLKNILENGYPVLAQGERSSLKSLFSGETGNGVRSSHTVNHLFSKEIYDATGYYEYSSFENYAYLNRDTGNFTVYNQLGTPEAEKSTDYLYQRGNFFPFNNIAAGKLSQNTNLYDDDGNKLNEGDYRYNEALYATQPDPTYYNNDEKKGNNPNFYFGMYMEAYFVQPKDGKVEWNGTLSPMRYEFNGDDDLWVFIDEVLLLDIGGIHVAHRGYIDFSTGEIGWYDGANNAAQTLSTTTIKAMYREAGIFPDGTRWDENKVNEYFNGNTYIDYSAHTLKMFYMERGDGASDLHVRFNIPVIPKGTFELTKELTNTDKEKYTNVEFAFQAYAQEIVSTDTHGIETYSENYVPLTAATYKGTSENIEFKDDQVFNEKEYDNVFYLKPGETVIFTGLQENRKYYVVEIGVNAKEFDKVVINNVGYIEYTEEEQASGIITDIETTKVEVLKRPVVVYENNCSSYNLRELKITKRMAEGQSSKDSFTFQVFLENENGELVPYVGPYYLQDGNNNYLTYVNGNLTTTEQAVVCGTTTEEGLITGVKVGYTAVITQILSSTDFKVKEVNFNTYVYIPPKITVDQNSVEAPELEGSLGTIKLGTNAIVTIVNEFQKEQDKPYIKVEKTFSGLTQEQIDSLAEDFKILVSNSDNTKVAELLLSEGNVVTEDNGNITYTWILENYPAGTYQVSEAGYELAEYIVTASSNAADGTLSIAAAEITYQPGRRENSCSETVQEVGAVNLIIAKLTDGYFVWTKQRASVNERLAIINLINTSQSEGGIGFNPEAKMSNSYFYSGDISDTLIFREGTITYDGVKNLTFTNTNQWAMYSTGSYKVKESSSAEIQFSNAYEVEVIEIDLVKTTDNGTKVEGAEFSLFKFEIEEGEWQWVKQNEEPIVVNNEEATDSVAYELQDIKAGRYLLIETKAPEGCQILTEAIYFSVAEKVVTLTDQEGNPLTTNPEMWSLDGNTITVKNTVVYELPSTGGFGIYAPMIGGSGMMVAAATIFMTKKKEESE